MEPVTSINGTNKHRLGDIVLGHSSGFSSLLHAARQLFSLPVNSLGTPQFFRSSVISPCLLSLRKASRQFWFFLHTPWQFFRLSVSYLSILLARVQCCFTSTQTVRTIGDREPRTATSTFTQLLSSGQLFWLDVSSSDVPSIIQTPHQFFRLHVNFSDSPSILQTSRQFFRLHVSSSDLLSSFQVIPGLYKTGEYILVLVRENALITILRYFVYTILRFQRLSEIANGIFYRKLMYVFAEGKEGETVTHYREN